MFVWLSTFLACERDPFSGVLPPPLPIAARAVRISVALRGIRPTEAELATVVADPAALDLLIDRWLADPAFGETVRDLHAERFELRADQKIPWPALGPLTGTPTGEISRAMSEQALRLVERVVTEDWPYTDILTTGETEADAILAAAWGLPFDPSGPSPAAVVLAGRPTGRRDPREHRVVVAPLLEPVRQTPGPRGVRRPGPAV